MTAAPATDQDPTHGPRRWSRLTSAPATRALRRRSCSRPSRSSTSPARTSAGACSSPPIRTAASCACGRTSPSRCRATISPRPSRRGGGLLLSRPGVPPSRRCAGRVRAGRHRILRRGRDNAAADAEMLALGLDATAHYGIAAPEIRMGDVGLFAALIAALDLAPAWKRRLVKDFNRTGSLAHDLDQLVGARGARAAGISGRARRAGRLRPEGRARAGHRPALDRRHQHGRRAHRRRDRRPLSRAGGARRQLPALPRATRALIEKFLAIAGDPDEAADALRALASRARARSRGRARPVRKPHRLPRRARRRGRAHPLLDRVRPRARLLHRLRVRAARSGRSAPTRQLVAGGRYDGLLTRLGAKRADPGGRLRGVDRARRARSEARHERAVRHRGAVEGAAAGKRRGVLRARRPQAGQAARRARLSRRDRRAARRRDRLSVGLRDRRAAGAGRGASRRHRRGPDARDHSRRRRSAWC